MQRSLAMSVPLLLLLATSGRAGAQGAAAPRLPWDSPPPEAGAGLERDGFRRSPAEQARYAAASGGGFQRVSEDASQSTYTRAAARATESLFLRSHAGRTVQLVYSAVGDSAVLQAKLDAVAADASARLGAPRTPGGWRTADGGHLVAPASPRQLPGGDFQFAVMYFVPGRNP